LANNGRHLRGPQVSVPKTGEIAGLHCDCVIDPGALGIGATTAMYSIVRSVLLSPLPYENPTQLVGIGFTQPGGPPNNEQTGATGDVLLANSTVFSSIGIADDGAPRQRIGKYLIVAQVALASTLLSAGALLLGAFIHMRSIPPGFQPQHVFALQVTLKGDAYVSTQHTQQFITSVEEHLRRIPGIVQVATVNGLPLDRGLNTSGGPAAHRELIKISEARFITPGYFRSLGTTVLAGADISDADTVATQPVALINERAAKLWFPGVLRRSRTSLETM
jgi:hypothetical protein